MDNQGNKVIEHTETNNAPRKQAATRAANEMDGPRAATSNNFPPVQVTRKTDRGIATSPSQIEPAQPVQRRQRRRRQGGGPRTVSGKQRSRQNAIKHGIFSDTVLLRRESRHEYQSLLTALREDFRPEGALEELLVEKLAMLAWRYRRSLSSKVWDTLVSSEQVLCALSISADSASTMRLSSSTQKFNIMKISDRP